MSRQHENGFNLTITNGKKHPLLTTGLPPLNNEAILILPRVQWLSSNDMNVRVY
jgi:hypothetical protein